MSEYFLEDLGNEEDADNSANECSSSVGHTTDFGLEGLTLLPTDNLQVQFLRKPRFGVTLEAGTSASQKIDEEPLTYLNKSQTYVLSLNDDHKSDEQLTTVIRVCFHELHNTKEQEENWKVWQQMTPNTKPIEVDEQASSLVSIEIAEFDCIKFKWNGKQGSKIALKLNCLSSDFSRSKGVKGVPLRLQSETRDSYNMLEIAYCRIQIFRDKGAQRKNRDDQKQVEKRIEKIKEVNKKGDRKFVPYAPQKPHTQFLLSTVSFIRGRTPPETPSVTPSYESLKDSTTPKNPSTPCYTPDLSQSNRRKFESCEQEFENLDLGSNEVSHPSEPLRRKKRSVLCILVRTVTDVVYTAIFLEQLTVEDMKRKMAQKFGIEGTIKSLYKLSRKGLHITIDDDMIEHFDDESDFIMETKKNSDGSLSLVLK